MLTGIGGLPPEDPTKRLGFHQDDEIPPEDNTPKDKDKLTPEEKARLEAEEKARLEAEEKARREAEEERRKSFDLLNAPPPTKPKTRGVDDPNGPNGTDGVDKTDGVDGPDGVDAPDGSDKTEHMTEEEAIAQGYIVIKTAEDLMAIKNNLSGKYIIMGDIDLTDIDWSPVGSEEEPFTGELNGNGYTIKNLNIKVDEGADTENVGFFGVTSNATISNIALDNVTIDTPETYSKGSVGALIGRAENTNLDNVTVTNANIKGHQKVGGLIGTLATTIPAKNSTIKNCSVNADVSSSYYAGGLIGYLETFDGNCNVVIENTNVTGNVTSDKKCAGGFIGEAGSTIVTINKCNSGANITGADGAQRIGGFIGNANGTKIAICNSKYTGSINAQGDFQGEWYGHYMNDAHLSIFELSAGLPVDDILMIEGVDGLDPIYNADTGNYEYEITVSTLTGLDKVVAMIRQNPQLAEIVTFNVNFDFEAMDGAYSPSIYAQYGVVQHQYEDEEGNVVNDVYIDNEIDCESTFHRDELLLEGEVTTVELEESPYEETMVKGLYKDKHGNYYVSTMYGMIPTTLSFFFESQKTNVKTRLDEDEVKYRDKITSMVKDYQRDIREMMKAFFNYDGVSNVIIGEPEYEYLKSKQASGEEFSDLEALQFNIYEMDMKVIDLVQNATHNNGCGMGGDSSFLEKDTAVPMYDEEGNMRFRTLEGTELRQKIDEEGNPLLDDGGNPLYQNLDGEDYNGDADSVFIVRGYPKTDEDGRFLYTDESGQQVIRTENEDGTMSYSYEDGSAYEGETDSLSQQLDEYNIADEFAKLQEQMQQLLKEYEEKYGPKE